MTGKLIIVPTPLGNLGDMTLRALDALRSADTVCAEDTRVTGKLLAALDIAGKRLERLDENVVGQRAVGVAQRVLAGETIAYCTDAGMPGVSDPGLRLVAAAREAGAPVEVLPGPSAAVTAYVASGTTAQAFYFGGFFPRKGHARVDELLRLKGLDAALLFYESPKRLVSALEAIAEVLPNREVAVCRELTKLHEEVVRGAAGDVLERFRARDAVKGEIVIVIDPPSSVEHAGDAAERLEAAGVRALQLAGEGVAQKAIASLIATEYGISRNDAYAIALESKRLTR